MRQNKINEGICLNTTEEFYRSSPYGIAPHETTVSHYLRHRNIYTKKRLSYGKTIAKEFINKGVLKDGATILEIGGGEGDLARNFIEYLIKDGINILQYIMLDINPHFLSLQKNKTKKFLGNVGFILANSLPKLPFENESIDFIIANEVIGDFPVIKNLRPKVIRDYQNILQAEYGSDELALLEEAVNVIKKYDLQIPQRKKFSLNYGAILFLLGAFDVLKPNGSVFISEHSCEIAKTNYWEELPGLLLPHEEKGFPSRISLKGHDEYNIKFSHLEAVAERIGFKVESAALEELLELRSFGRIEESADLIINNGAMGNSIGHQLEIYDFVPTMLQFRYLLLAK